MRSWTVCGRVAPRIHAAGASPAACPPIGSLVKDSAGTWMTTAMIVLICLKGWSDERGKEKLRKRRTWQDHRHGRTAGEGRPAPSDVPSPQGLQVLRGQDRRHQLQGHEASDAVRARARQDPAAPDFGNLRHAPAEAAHGDHAGATARAHPVYRRIDSFAICDL